MTWRMQPDTTDGKGPEPIALQPPSQHDYGKSVASAAGLQVTDAPACAACDPEERLWLFWNDGYGDDHFEEYPNTAEGEKDVIERADEIHTESSDPDDLEINVVVGRKLKLQRAGYSIQR